MSVTDWISIENGRLCGLLASGLFFFAMAGDANAQMSSTNCMVMGGGLISCNTMDMGPQPYEADRGALLGQLIVNIREKSFRKKVGRMLADGDCQGAARLAYEKGRLELGSSIANACQSARQPVQSAATRTESSTRIAPDALESVLVKVAQNAKTPMEIFEETTVFKVDAVGKQLIMTALVGRKGAAITESGRLRIVKIVCEASSSILEAGATVRIDFYEQGKRSAFDAIVTTQKDCGFRG